MPTTKETFKVSIYTYMFLYFPWNWSYTKQCMKEGIEVCMFTLLRKYKFFRGFQYHIIETGRHYDDRMWHHGVLATQDKYYFSLAVDVNGLLWKKFSLHFPCCSSKPDFTSLIDVLIYAWAVSLLGLILSCLKPQFIQRKKNIYSTWLSLPYDGIKSCPLAFNTW